MTEPMPTEGGRYIRDPLTGALTRVDESETASTPEPERDVEPDSATAPAEVAPAAPATVTAEPSPRGKKRI